MEQKVDTYLPQLASRWHTDLKKLEGYWEDLRSSREFLENLNGMVRGVPEFSGANFLHVENLRVYRCFLYLLTRAVVPEVFVETGVLNGFGSAFILLGMQHNRKGILISVDLPPSDERIFAQGTHPLPKGKSCGWAIPENLRARHQLLLGPAQKLLPEIFEKKRSIDVFLHDSDHSYPHMMFELGLAWGYLKTGGWLLCDNVEANAAFEDFSRGVRSPAFILASFDTPERVWKHGMIEKTEA
jgi:predicted O-methyltransferase YrrM